MPGMYLPPSLSIFMAAEGKVGGEKAPSGGASAAQKNWIMVPVNAICPIFLKKLMAEPVKLES